MLLKTAKNLTLCGKYCWPAGPLLKAISRTMCVLGFWDNRLEGRKTSWRCNSVLGVFPSCESWDSTFGASDRVPVDLLGLLTQEIQILPVREVGLGFQSTPAPSPQLPWESSPSREPGGMNQPQLVLQLCSAEVTLFPRALSGEPRTQESALSSRALSDLHCFLSVGSATQAGTGSQ